MAYSNWEAKVYRNGERMENREDVGVFDEDEAIFPKDIRIFANLMKNEDHEPWWMHSHHAVLGDGKVRLCGYKYKPELWIWRDGADEPEKMKIIDEDEYWEIEGPIERSGEVELEGKKWYWKVKCFDNKVELELKEPDGTVWTAVSGYRY